MTPAALGICKSYIIQFLFLSTKPNDIISKAVAKIEQMYDPTANPVVNKRLLNIALKTHIYCITVDFLILWPPTFSWLTKSTYGTVL